MNNIILYNVILLIISLLITYLIHKYLNTNIINMSNILKKDIEKFTVSTPVLTSGHFKETAYFNTHNSLNDNINNVKDMFVTAGETHNISDAKYNTLIKNKSDNKPTLEPNISEQNLETLSANEYLFTNLSET
jgi:hypothetical protein